MGASHSTVAGSLGDDVDPLMIPIYRRATAEQKLAVVGRLNAALIALKESQLAQKHSDWPVERQREALRAWWLKSESR